MTKKVVVGMSGGVDSSVAAYLLKEQGYQVIGVTMQIWQNEPGCEVPEEGGCCGLSAVEDARRVADQLDIPYYVLNFRAEFKKHVIDYFLQEYSAGRTPNPCIACNRYVKWESLLDKALQLDADYIATGHYARIQPHPVTGRLAVKRSVTDAKDQSYALYSLTQFQLERTLMPLGAYTKDEVRKIAAELGLLVAAKPDSQEICFVPGNNYGRFLAEQGISSSPGDFVDPSGNVLGRHKGIAHYTVGQRKGLGAFGRPVFVKEIDPVNNRVVLAVDEKEIFQSTLWADDLNFMAWENFSGPRKAFCKIRYSHKAAPCTMALQGDKIRCDFADPQRAITPGQAAVFYDEDFILCGGTILKGE